MPTPGATGSAIAITSTPAFTMLELSNIADCNALRRYLIKKGLTDLSPKTAGMNTVSFCGNTAKKYGAGFIGQLQKLPADWLVLSGHHGILYASDYGSFAVDPTVDPSDCYNNNKYAGFFNNDYHHGRWEQATRSLPNTGKNDSELYCSTTEPASSGIAPFSQANPYIPTDAALLGALKTRCKGIILSACNTFSYRHVRKKWVKHFPNAVIFGTYGKIKMGLHVIQALMSAPSTTTDFWLNPQAVLDSSPDMPQKISKEVFKQGNKKGTDIGMIYKNVAYVSAASATDPMDELPVDFIFN
ncbi:MAG: hypothetical protein JW863_01180 [Chitinispirillaceae bacterium]|nr:hypothetical protein [Chitinispirillaceae bacterium]